MKRHDTLDGLQTEREERGSREDTKEAASWREKAPTQTDTESMPVTKLTSPKRTKS
jgi:hypothetical protein